MASSVVYWTSDGGGDEGGEVTAVLHTWIRNQNDASLIVYGGDIYASGTADQYSRFLEQVGGNLDLNCGLPGNHDWLTSGTDPFAGRIPHAYETFWRGRPSRQQIDTSKRSGARYEHFIDLNGWRLIFLDTGLCHEQPWPIGDLERLRWLHARLTEKPGRAKLIFGHHSRLSRGIHGDNPGVDGIWRALFTDSGLPLAACTIGGHDHNVSIYSPRPARDPGDNKVNFDKGIYVVVNGAGGNGFYEGDAGTDPDLFRLTDGYCVTRIELVSDRKAILSTIGFGPAPRPFASVVVNRLNIDL
jgi:Calcineurin-like phosphoesterase